MCKQTKGTTPVCHSFLSDPTFYQFLFKIDQDIAAKIQAEGCPCGGVLHSARYPRKPRGIRGALDETYCTRLSFCCAEDGCRRRMTPPSVRFLGRKVYLGVMVLLMTAIGHGLSVQYRQALIETINPSPQTLWRWRRWWQRTFPKSRCWKAEQGLFIPPIPSQQLPDDLLERLTPVSLMMKTCHVLRLVAPTTTDSWMGFLRVSIDPQRM
jgi:hypothetical protein